jgi:hypothetical protein
MLLQVMAEYSRTPSMPIDLATLFRSPVARWMAIGAAVVAGGYLLFGSSRGSGSGFKLLVGLAVLGAAAYFGRQWIGW